MKKTLNFIACTAIAAALVSCSGFLDENPTTSLSETSVYSTEEALEAQIYGIMSAFYGKYMMMGYMNEQLHTASGLLMWKGQRTQDAWMDGLKFAKYSDVEPNQQWYLELYSAISCCNRLLDNLPGSLVESGYKTEIEAEARFYRAVLYYYLVRLYGDVPLVLTCPRTIAETNKPRTVYYKVYETILEDFGFAEKNMRDKSRVDALTPGHGRPCRWAATAMKSSVYMTIGSLLSSFEADSADQFFDTSKDGGLIAEGKDPRTPDFKAIGISNAAEAWTLCYNTARKVIDEGPYHLAGDYRQLFRWTEPEDFELEERIFCLQSSNEVDNENKLAQMSLPPYPEGSASGANKNGNAGRYRPSRFVFQKFAGENGGVKGTSGANKNIYVSCSDPRFNATFYYDRYVRTDKGSTLKLYPEKNHVTASEDAYAMPYFKKYLDPKWNVSAGYADFYLMRLAEIYLIEAEAAARLSTANGDNWWNIALDCVEVIHERARKSVDDPSSPAPFPTWEGRTFKNSEELLDAIFWERIFELYGEGHEYFDTHRNGAKWLSRVIAVPLNEFNQLPEQNCTGGIFPYNYVGTEFPEDPSDLRKSLLCGFPTTTEATYNTAIDPVKDQNDFFWR